MTVEAVVVKKFGHLWMSGRMICAVDQYEEDYVRCMTGRHPGFAVGPASLRALLEDLDGETCFEPHVKQNLRENLLRIIEATPA